MRTLVVVALLLVAQHALAQDTAAAIARFAELGILHNNAAIDADNIESIQSLRISSDVGAQLTDQDVLHLTTLPRLGHLTIGGVPNVTPAGLAQLVGVSSLWNLSFRGADLTDDQVAALSGLVGSRSLDLALNRQMTDGAMPAGRIDSQPGDANA